MLRDPAAHALEIFDAVVELPPPQREKRLSDLCGSDAALREEVESLLAHDDPDWRGLSRPDFASALATGCGDEVGSSWSPKLPMRFGRYELLEEIGEGGMGVVYRARQTHPDRFVAVKLLARSVGSRQLAHRFSREVQTLARLSHPGIARIYDAGVETTSDGPRPYIAMELVEGRSLLEYARRHDLDTAARLQLLMAICDAVHHAHQKGVIHRDLKPENILVADECGVRSAECGMATASSIPAPADGPMTHHSSLPSAQPKILDFGIARLIGESAPSTTLATQPGQLLGTLAYMAPEQIDGRADTLSDVYALGVLAFQLLTRKLPIQIHDCPVLEAVRRIKEQPPTPLRRVDSRLSVDLERVIGKALSKEPSARYESAAALAADVRRYLRQEPVLAREPSLIYVIGKLAKRRRGAVIAASLALLAIAGSAVVSTYYAVVASSARRETGEIAGFLAADVAKYLNSVAGTADTRRDMLTRLHTQVEALLRQSPDDDRLLSTYASVLRYLGNAEFDERKLDSATDYRRRAVEARRRVLRHNPDDPVALEDYAHDLILLGDAHKEVDEKGEVVRSLYEEAMRIQQQLLEIDPGSDRYQDNLGWSYERLAYWGEWDERRKLVDRRLEIARRLLERNPSHASALAGMRSGYLILAGLVQAQGDDDASLAHLKRAVEYGDQLLALAPDDRYWMELYVCAATSLAHAAKQAGDLSLAEASLDKCNVVVQRLEQLEPTSVRSLQARINYLGGRVQFLLRQDQFEEASKHLAEIQTDMQTLFRMDQVPQTFSRSFNGWMELLGEVALKAGWDQQAAACCAANADPCDDALAFERPEAISRWLGAACALAYLGEPPPDTAEAICVLQRLTREPAGDNAFVWWRLGETQANIGDHAAAGRSFRNALERMTPDKPQMRMHLERRAQDAERAATTQAAGGH